jgi:hypothetical protein
MLWAKRDLFFTCFFHRMLALLEDNPPTVQKYRARAWRMPTRARR